MAEAKKAGTARARKPVSAPKAGPELALETVKSVADSDIETALPPVAAAKAAPHSQPTAAPMEEPIRVSQFRPERADALRQALSQAALATAHGALEINDKVITAVRDQSEAAIDLWRSAVHAPHLADALHVQTSGTRQAYEAASAQWKDIAETTARWFHKSLEPLQAMITDRAH